MGISIGFHSGQKAYGPRYTARAMNYPATPAPFFDVGIQTANGDEVTLYFENAEEARQFTLDLGAAIAAHGTYPDEPADIAGEIEADPFAAEPAWRKCGEPKDIGQWVTPPACQGQIVLVSYTRGEDGLVFRRTWDQSDGTRSYDRRFLADEELFEPWQTQPE